MYVYIDHILLCIRLNETFLYSENYFLYSNNYISFVAKSIIFCGNKYSFICK